MPSILKISRRCWSLSLWSLLPILYSSLSSPTTRRLVCPGNKVDKPQSAYEKRSIPNITRAKSPLVGLSTKVNSTVSTRWRALDRRRSRRRDGRSNRMLIPRLLLAWMPQTSTRQRDVRTDTARDQAIRDAGFDLVVMWQCEMPQAAKHLLGYYVDDRAGQKNKASAKGISKKHNDITWWRYVSTLQGRNHHAQNRGFRMVGGCMKTYLQDKLGLSANYDKRQVLPMVFTRNPYLADIKPKIFDVSSTTHPLRNHAYQKMLLELRENNM